MRAALLPLVAIACTVHTRPPPRPTPVLAPVDAAHDVVRYEARLGERFVDAEVWAPVGVGALVTADAALLPYFREVELERDGVWTRLRPELGPWRVPACARGCHLRWRLAIGAAARDLDDQNAARFADTWLAPPGTFLLRFDEAPSSWTFRLHVDHSADTSFVTGVLPARAADRPLTDSYEADLGSLPDLPYTAFGRFRSRHLRLVDAELEVAILGPVLEVGDARVLAWIEAAASTIRHTFGGFPLAHAAILILVEDGDQIGEATTMGNGGGAAMLRVGRSTPTEAFLDDWKMTHEMIHLSSPNVPQRWFEEGLATYVEPLARARDGLLGPEQFWRETMRGLPLGAPRPSEGGLDATPTWGRTYWGGATFFLLADLDIREKTHDQRSLDDALRAIARAGGNAAVRWDLEQVLEIGDRATGTRCLHELYARMGKARYDVDLAALFRQLGVESRHGQIVYDDSAPLAQRRRALTGRR